MLFGYCTRLRIGDIANMTWNAVDLEKGTIQIVPKKIREYQEGGFYPHSRTAQRYPDRCRRSG